MYIILEYYLLENFIINFLILYITKSINKRNIKLKRIILGAIISGLYSLVFFYPKLLFLTKPFMKFIISILIVKFTFNTKGIRLFLYDLIGFYIVSFILAGMILGISFATSSPEFLFKEIDLTRVFKFKHIVIGVILASIISIKLFNYNNSKKLKSNYISPVRIFYRGNILSIMALIDTGNSLIEPLSKSPVMIVEYEEIKSILPESIRSVYEDNKKIDYQNLEDILNNSNGKIPLNIIPFKSIGEDSGIILGFKPDYLLINRDNGEMKKDNVIIGIYNGRLSKERNYNGLLNLETIS